VAKAWAASEAAAAAAAEAVFPLFDTRAVSLEEEAPLECQPTGRDAQATASGAGELQTGAGAGVMQPGAGVGVGRGCWALSGVGDPAAAQEVGSCTLCPPCHRHAF